LRTTDRCSDADMRLGRYVGVERRNPRDRRMRIDRASTTNGTDATDSTDSTDTSRNRDPTTDRLEPCELHARHVARRVKVSLD
jgi:hypothetical protein